MLPTAKMVNLARRQLERLYDCTCYVISEIDAMDPDTGIMNKTSRREGPFPCRISHKTLSTGQIAEISKFSTITVLFAAPDVVIPKGARIELVGRNTKQLYRSASISARYDTHQEVQLENLEVH